MKKYLLLVFLLPLVLMSCHREKRLITLKAYQYKVDEMYEKTRKMAAGRDSAVFSVVNDALSAEERDAMKFILAFAPLSDLADCDGAYFLRQVRTTLLARAEMPWGKDIPEEVFLHFVLPLRVNNENLDTFRSATYAELKKRVQHMNMHDAALEINHWCHEKVTYKGSDERTSSPLSTIRTSWGRCGEESTFTVSALRAVGIPARQVYTPRWAHTDDNHAWVEVWVNGTWYFMGACEPDPKLNQGWFSEPSKRTMLVHTRAYGYYLGKEPVIDREDRFAELNLISHYAPCKTFRVKVLDPQGKNVQGARVEFRLYNYAEYYPIATQFTGTEGQVSITTGLGDLLIWANDGKRTAYQKISVGKTGDLSLTLKNNIRNDITENLDIVPPPRPEPGPADTAGQAFNKHRFATEDSIRKAYMSTFRDSVWCGKFAGTYALNHDSTLRLFRQSQGNWKNISRFLKDCGDSRRKFAFRMLFTLSDKDLRDFSAEILLDHLKNLPTDHYTGISWEGRDLFLWYVASPRIQNEMIRRWRGDLVKTFGYKTNSPEAGVKYIHQWILSEIRIDDAANLHSRAPVSPAGLLQLKVSDSRSRNIFFVAACRSVGIAARINPVNLLPEYWSQGQWKVIRWEEKKEMNAAKGFVHFIAGNPNIDGRYMQHFTLSKLENGRLFLYEYDEGRKLSEFPDRVELDTGQYLLTTGNRMSDGGVLSNITFFRVGIGQTSDVIVTIREPKLSFRELPHIDMTNYTFREVSSEAGRKGNEIFNSNGSILVWLEPAQEPSRHVVVDIPPFKENFEKWTGRLAFIFRDQKNIQLPDKPAMAALPKNALYLVDEKNTLLQYLEKQMNTQYGSNLPLLIYNDPKGHSWLISEGYSIGTGEILGRIISR